MFVCTLIGAVSSLQVEAIKTGMCDSMYDTLQTLNPLGVANALPKKCTEAVSIEVEPAEKNSVHAIGRDLTYQHSELDYISIRQPCLFEGIMIPDNYIIFSKF